jgi:hypothetical protein
VVDILVKESLKKEGESSKDHVVTGDVIGVIQGLTRETINKSKEELRKSKYHVLVEKVDH